MKICLTQKTITESRFIAVTIPDDAIHRPLELVWAYSMEKIRKLG
jgi:hypothetical protein